MDKKILLSILIPTKNRTEYALKVAHHILNINDERFQVVIQDNSETNLLERLLSEKLNDPRLKYIYNSGILSFTDNFSKGIENCEGEYVTIIGDDDGINPVILDIANWASINGIDAITPSLPLIYFWPESGINTENDQGKLIISKISCKVKFTDPGQEVIKLMKNGCQSYLTYELVKVYHGMTKRSVLLEIKNITGNYIGGLSPDIYLSVAASLLVKRVLIVDYPLTISGICKRSGSADSATGRHVGTLEQAPHFKGHFDYKWSGLVPAFYSVETIWADSALAAITDMKFYKYLEYYNVDAISAYCKSAYPQFSVIIMNNLVQKYNSSRNSISLRWHLFKGFLTGPLLNFIRKVKNKIIHNKKYNTFNAITDIEKASEIIKLELDAKYNLILNRLKNLINKITK
jgi:glycosyltransferase involved in cell wall biosynthesis